MFFSGWGGGGGGGGGGGWPAHANTDLRSLIILFRLPKLHVHCCSVLDYYLIPVFILILCTRVCVMDKKKKILQ